MTKLPRGVSGEKAMRALKRAGFYIRRVKGSHFILRREKPFAQVVIPRHKSLDAGTLDSILESANLSVERFIDFL